jgi:hypothetical protein
VPIEYSTNPAFNQFRLRGFAQMLRKIPQNTLEMLAAMLASKLTDKIPMTDNSS